MVLVNTAIGNLASPSAFGKHCDFNCRPYLKPQRCIVERGVSIATVLFYGHSLRTPIRLENGENAILTPKFSTTKLNGETPFTAIHRAERLGNAPILSTIDAESFPLVGRQ